VFKNREVGKKKKREWIKFEYRSKKDQGNEVHPLSLSVGREHSQRASSKISRERWATGQKTFVKVARICNSIVSRTLVMLKIYDEKYVLPCWKYSASIWKRTRVSGNKNAQRTVDIETEREKRTHPNPPLTSA